MKLTCFQPVTFLVTLPKFLFSPPEPSETPDSDFVDVEDVREYRLSAFCITNTPFSSFLLRQFPYGPLVFQTFMPASPDAWKGIAVDIHDWLIGIVFQKDWTEWRWGVNLF